jgi:tRNA threonylcarbamoyladenosine biosynthesis protein TsaB
MKLLGIDTSTEACTAALLTDGTVIERFEMVRHGHSERLLPMVESVLREAGMALEQCDAVAFGRGPGSFTALRIGVAAVQGLAFGAGLPVISVSSLAALAQGQDAAQRVIAAVDARMDQVYWGCFERAEDGVMRPAGEEHVSSPAAVELPEGQAWLGAGSGWDRYADRLLVVLDGRVQGWRPEQFPHAGALLRLAALDYAQGKVLDAAAALPRYLRDDVARKSGARS